MARKIIKVILFILAALVVAGGIATYLKSKKETAAPVAARTEKKAPEVPVAPVVRNSQLQQVVVNTQGGSAQVQIKGVNEHNYDIQHVEQGDGFKILIPHTQVGQVQPLFDKPNPLIKKIEVHPAKDNPESVELVFYTEKNVNFLDTQKNDTLTIDFIKSEVVADEKKASSTELTPPASKSKKTVATKTTKGKKTGATSKTKSGSSALASSGSKQKSTAASIKKSKKDSSVKLKPFVPDASSDFAFDDQATANTNQATDNLIPDEKPNADDLKNNQPINLKEFGTTAAPTENIAKEEPPTIDTRKVKKPTDEEEGFMNLKDAVKEEPKATAPATPPASANLLDAETQMSLDENVGKNNQKVAALPNQKFDLNQLQANLPALENMSVVRSGSSTVVTFDREKSIPFKVFRMVNPSRIVVDFKDAKNKLKADYPRFAGTKISRVETRAYAGTDGMLVRVIMYVDGAPSFTSTKNGNQLQIDLQ